MNYRIEFDDDLMMVLDDENNGHDAFEVDADRPWDAVETLAEWGREYSLDACNALRELRIHLRECE
jgi:hypothetical protein